MTVTKKMMMILSSLMLTAQALLASGEFIIATNSMPKAAIVVADDAPVAVKYAASELAKYLNKMTRSSFPLVSSPIKGWNTILVGGETDQTAFDGIDIRLSRDSGIFFSKDTSTLTIAGERPRAVIYAVYDLLETLGCGFWTPNSETVPFKPYISLPEGYAKRDAPAMRYRSGNHYTTGAKFMVKLRANENRGGSKEIGIAPGEGENIMHSLVLKWIPRSKFFKTKPEWFALVPRTDKATGEKKMIRVNGALCMTNPEMREELLKEVGDFLKKNYPYQKSISLSPSDMGDYCHCEKCTALMNTDASKAPTLLYLDLQRFVADHFREKYPEATFNLLSYWSTDTPPVDTKKWRLRDNCGVGFAALWRNHGFPIDCNERFAPRVKAWLDMSDNFIYWDYYANFSAYLNPFPNLDILGPAFKFYRDNHFIGGFAQMPHTRMAPLADLNWYLMGKLMWNPDADTEKLTADFIKGVYGPGAPHVRRFMDILRHAKLRDRGIWVGCYVADTANFLTPSDVIEMLRALDALVKATGNSPEEMQVAAWRLRYAGIHTAVMRYPDLIEPAKKMKYKLASWESYRSQWYSYINDYRNRRSQIGYPQQCQENSGWENWGSRYIEKIMAAGTKPAEYPAKTQGSYVIPTEKLTGGRAMSFATDDTGKYAKLTFGFGGGEKIFMNPSYAEVGYTVSNELTGTWVVLSKMRVGSTHTNNPAAAYMGIYTPWIVNGARIGRSQSEIASLTIPSSPGEDDWRWVALGEKTLYKGARVWIMPGVLARSRFLDVKNFAFVDPAKFFAKTVPAVGGVGARDTIDNYAYRVANVKDNPQSELQVRFGGKNVGECELFARVRVINSKVLDAAAGRLELCRPSANKDEKPTVIASQKIFGSAGEEVWQLVYVARAEIKAGDYLRFTTGDSGNAIEISLRDAIMVDTELLDEAKDKAK